MRKGIDLKAVQVPSAIILEKPFTVSVIFHDHMYAHPDLFSPEKIYKITFFLHDKHREQKVNSSICFVKIHAGFLLEREDIYFSSY